jgi:hypothetical protein
MKKDDHFAIALVVRKLQRGYEKVSRIIAVTTFSREG